MIVETFGCSSAETLHADTTRAATRAPQGDGDHAVAAARDRVLTKTTPSTTVTA